jgi:hypothetical protein
LLLQARAACHTQKQAQRFHIHSLIPIEKQQKPVLFPCSPKAFDPKEGTKGKHSRFTTKSHKASEA